MLRLLCSRSDRMLSCALTAVIIQLVLLFLQSPFKKAVPLTVALSLKCLTCCWLCFSSSRESLRDINQKGQVECMKQATSVHILGEPHKVLHSSQEIPGLAARPWSIKLAGIALVLSPRERGNLFLCLICCFCGCQISLCEYVSFPSHP